MYDVVYLSRVIAKVGFTAALLCNFLLIYLTGWHTQNITGPYKYMIIFCALLGVFFSCTEMVAKPFAHNYNGAFIYFSLTEKVAGWKSIFEVLLAIYAGTYAALISSITVLFIYRLTILVKPELLPQLFNGWRLSIWIFYISIFGLIWALLVYHCGYPNGSSIRYIQGEFEAIYKTSIHDTAVFIVLAYENNPEPVLQMSSVACIVGTVSILVFQYIIMAICGFQIHFQMNEKLKNFSEVHQRLHRQLFKTLVIQITVPTILFHLPVLPILVTPFLNIEVSLQTGFAYSLFSLYPPIDSLTIIGVVSEYRIAIKSQCRIKVAYIEKVPVFRAGS